MAFHDFAEATLSTLERKSPVQFGAGRNFGGLIVFVIVDHCDYVHEVTKVIGGATLVADEVPAAFRGAARLNKTYVFCRVKNRHSLF